MSYNRPPLDSAGGRHRVGSSGSGSNSSSRDREHSRPDRPDRTDTYPLVSRDRIRSGSMDQGQPRSINYSQSQSSRWTGQERYQRAGTQVSSDQERVHWAQQRSGLPRRHPSEGSHGMQRFVAKHSVSGGERFRGAVETSESLEEGELDMEDRRVTRRLTVNDRLGLRAAETRHPQNQQKQQQQQQQQHTRQPVTRDATPSPRRSRDEDESVHTEVPKLELQSRISDIDREIAECQERLVRITSVTAEDVVAPAQNEAQPQALAQSDDRTVPGSPLASPNRAPLEPAAPSELLPASAAAAATAAEGSPLLVPQQASSSPGTSSSSSSSSSALDSDSNDEHMSDPESALDNDGSKDRTRALVASIYADNQRRAAAMHAELAQPFLQAYPQFVPGMHPQPQDWPFWKENEAVDEQLRPHLARLLGREHRQDRAHARRLQEEYRDLYARWRRRVDRLDRQREARQRGTPLQGAVAGGSHRRRGAAVQAADEFGFTLGPLFSASASAAAAAISADSVDASLFTSDAVHSDAELQKIIERLQYDDARNPDLRSQRTAAVIPNMVLGAKEHAMLRVDNGSHRVDDPMAFYHAHAPTPGSPEYRRVAYANNADPSHFWTQPEVSAFVAAYLAHPKQFGRIAAAIPHKSMNDCVLFYYRNKKPLRLKELEARSNKKSRRRQQQQPGGRKRKEKARERRERRAREERERMAVEAAASYVSAAEGGQAVVEDGQSSEEEGVSAMDVLDRRSKSSALLRSIIAANRQRKREAGGGDEGGAFGRSGLLNLALGVEEPEEDEEEVEPETRPRPKPRPRETTHTDPTPASAASASGSAPASADAMDIDSDLKAPMVVGSPPPSAVSDPASVSEPVSVSAVDSRQRNASSGNGSDIEGGASGVDDDDDEEEGELVEDDGHWEPRGSCTKHAQPQPQPQPQPLQAPPTMPPQKSRQRSEFNAYALGGSIVRTRRTCEIEQASAAALSSSLAQMPAASATLAAVGNSDSGSDSGTNDDDMEDEEIVEASGVVSAGCISGFPGISQGGTSGVLSRVVSRKSLSRFGVTLTAIVDATTGGERDTDSPSGFWHGQPSREKIDGGPVTGPSAASAAPHLDGSAVGERPTPKESALDRYVTSEPSVLKRPISSYETLLIGSTAATADTKPIGAFPGTAHKRMLEAQVEMEAGAQESVLVGAAVWVRDDRRRVLRGFHRLGADFAQVASLMPSKTMAQCRYFFFHYRTPDGALISDIIANKQAMGAADSSISSKATGMQPRVDSLVLPPVARRVPEGLVLPMGGAKRQRTQSPQPSAQPQQLLQQNLSAMMAMGSAVDSSGDEDDETPLAAQLAEELAAQALAMDNNSLPATPMPTRQNQQQQQQQRRASEVVSSSRSSELSQLQPRPSMTLVLPPKVPAIDPAAANNGSVASQQSGRTPSPALPSVAGPASATSTGAGAASSLAAAAATMTAKKSGYSSYWSVHERSAFMHYVVRLGQDWLGLAEAIGSKTGTQVRNYFRANREKLGLDAVIVEYQRNRLAGTVPPMTPFQPPPPPPAPTLPLSSAMVPMSSVISLGLGGSSAIRSAAGEEEGVRKEKRGRKRKIDLAKSAVAVDQPMPPLPMSLQMAGSSAPMVGPSTAPASMANFPTMGVDGGRAVIYARSSAALPGPETHYALQQHHHQQSPHHQSQSQQQQHQSQSQQPQSQQHQFQPNSHSRTRPPPLSLQQSSWPPRPPSFAAQGTMVRAESDTLSSQPTPPPVEGLPRFSSSPVVPTAYIPRSSVLQISNLTSAVSPLPPVARIIEEVEDKDEEDEEPRKVSVTKINALLNDDSPVDTPQKWFEDEDQGGQGDGGERGRRDKEEDEATGIAALALASMMEQKPVSRPSSVVHDRPLYPPMSIGPSAFSPLGNNAGSSSSGPMSPPQHPQHQQQQHFTGTRPSSVGPASIPYHQHSPHLTHRQHPHPHQHQHQHPQHLQQVHGIRQRKPSAPLPLPMPQSGGYMPYGSAGMQQQERVVLPRPLMSAGVGPAARRVVYHSPSAVPPPPPQQQQQQQASHGYHGYTQSESPVVHQRQMFQAPGQQQQQVHYYHGQQQQQHRQHPPSQQPSPMLQQPSPMLQQQQHPMQLPPPQLPPLPPQHPPSSQYHQNQNQNHHYPPQQ
ncbi:DNA-binding protein snt1 [Kickxella alabastrina]|uniref:DNA-binding protein snt1 n=1 Tax=Kickxella alabastrina TaxID=61397 RepID=A0ACC1INI8_9FUNG|nr:DNA-binding protein snt1 [Kickxella alabastrina]